MKPNPPPRPDRDRKRRWLRAHLGLLTVGTALLIAARYHPARETVATVRPDRSAIDGARQRDAGPTRPLSSVTHAVPPQGWRRTRHGWEHVSSWPGLGKSINQWIDHQHDQEPETLRRAFERVRNISPIMLALIQIAAIAAIVNMARAFEESETVEERDQPS